MAATCTSSLTNITEGKNTLMSVVRFTFVSHTDGTVAGVGARSGISGRIEHFRFIPDSGDTQPSDALDVTILDQYGHDVLMGVGANLSNTRTSTINLRTPLNTDQSYVCLFNATLTPSIANAGSGKGGVLELILR